MGTVSKALSLLSFFNQQRTEIGLSDLTRLSGINKATVYRLMQDLMAGGMVEQEGDGRAYRLGPEVLRLAALREAAVPLLSASRGILIQLSEATGETAHMSVLTGMQLNGLTHVYSSRHATRVMMDDAEVLSFHGTSSGLAVLAYAEAGFVEAVLSSPLPAHTDKTITSVKDLRRMLDTVRRDGIAESIGSFEADVHSHGVPVFGPDQRPLGALAVAAPVARMTDELKRLIRRELLLKGQELTQRIGGFCPPGWPARAAA